MAIDFTFNGALKIPLCMAPMFLISSPAMIVAAASRGVMGGFPAHSTRDTRQFIDWLDDIEDGLRSQENPAPWAVNIVLHKTNRRMADDLAVCVQRKVPVILTSKGAPADVFSRIHDYGGLVFHDVASARHAEKATLAGADALIAIAAGAGGKTGSVNPFALLHEIRNATDRPIILAGGMSTGRDVFAAEAMGASLAYLGTRFIATRESLSDAYTDRLMLNSSAKDILVSAALDGAPSSWVKSSLIAEGVDITALSTVKPGTILKDAPNKSRWKSIRSAGQGIGMISRVETVATLCGQLIEEYQAAKNDFAKRAAFRDSY
jgi:nitronate monooxygenase